MATMAYRAINRLSELALELGHAAGVKEIRLPIPKTLILDPGKEGTG